MKIYRITKFNHIEPILHFLSASFFSAIGCYLLYRYKMNFSNLDLIIKIFVYGMSGYLIPIVLIHLNHYFKNRFDSFQYDAGTGEIIYERRGIIRKIASSEIEKITVYKSWPLAKGRSTTLIWDSYNYAVIVLKDGTIIRLSSLLVNELDKVVNFENIEVKKTFYAWIK